MLNISLKRFMIFNSSYGQDEGKEGDKLLFHWTKDAPGNEVDKTEQIDDVCLCDASINATIRLSTNSKKNNRSLVLTFETSLVVIVEIESKATIWVAVHVELFSQTDSIERVIRNIYSRFSLINGTFQMIIDDVKKESDSEEDIRRRLRDICKSYFPRNLNDIHLDSIMTNIPSLYNFIVYLDLNPITLMKVNSFINHLICIEATQICHTIAIFNDQLVWSSMNKFDSCLLYNYLVAVLIRDAMQEELSREMDKVRRIKENMPIYLRYSNDDSNTDDSVSEQRLQRFFITVFRSSNNMTLGLIMKDPDQFELIQRCEHLLTSDSRLGVIPLASLAQSVGQNFLKSSAKTRQTSTSNTGKNQINLDQKYLCFDRLSESASWSPGIESSSQTNIPSSTASSGIERNSTQEVSRKNRKLRLTKYLLELEPELNQFGVKEFLGKTTSDTWLNVVESKYRSIYSIYKMRNAGLSEARQNALDLETAITSSRRRI